MRSFALLLSAGLVSAVNLAPPVVQSGTAVNVNGLNNSSQESSFGGNSGLNENSGFNNLNNLNNGGLDLSNLNLGGLNLGSVDLNNQNDLINAILAMQAGLCLNNIFDSNSLLNLGSSDDLDLFLELAQLMQLEQLGFLSIGGIQSLFNSGLVLGNFNVGAFKREVAKARTTMKRTKLRRMPATKRQANCQAAAGIASPGGIAAGGAAGVAAGAASVAPAASFTPVVAATSAAAAVATAAPAVASEAAAATQAAAATAPAAAVASQAASSSTSSSSSESDENLSDFTR